MDATTTTKLTSQATHRGANRGRASHNRRVPSGVFVLPPANCGSAGLTMSDYKRLEGDCREALKLVADTAAVQTILEQDYHAVIEVQNRLGPQRYVTMVQSQVNAILSAAEVDFENRVEEATGFTSKSIGRFDEAYSARLETSILRFLYLKHTAKHVSARQKDEVKDNLVRKLLIVRRKQQSVQQRKGSISDLDTLCDNIVDASLRAGLPAHGVDNEVINALDRAVVDFDNVFRRLMPSPDGRDADSLPPGSTSAKGNDENAKMGLTSAQIAYRTQHRRIAVKIWQANSAERLHTDTLQRSLVHLAVNAGDLQTLRELVSVDREIRTKALEDVFGLSLLALAAIRNDVTTFEFLLQHGASTSTVDKEGRTLIALASRSGSQAIVECIINRRLLISLPLNSLYCAALTGLNHAIEGRHEHRGKCIHTVAVELL